MLLDVFAAWSTAQRTIEDDRAAPLRACSVELLRCDAAAGRNHGSSTRAAPPRESRAALGCLALLTPLHCQTLWQDASKLAPLLTPSTKRGRACQSGAAPSLVPRRPHTPPDTRRYRQLYLFPFIADLLPLHAPTSSRSFLSHINDGSLQARAASTNQAKPLLPPSSLLTMDVLMGGSLRKRADEVACASQALYTYPTASDVVDSSVNTIVKWDKTCLDSGTNKIDIYLYAPTSAKANLPIHAWVEVPADKGSYDIKLKPAWWNVTTTLTQQTPLSLNIVKSGNEPWDSSNPVGPTFQVSAGDSKTIRRVRPCADLLCPSHTCRPSTQLQLRAKTPLAMPSNRARPRSSSKPSSREAN